MKLLDKSVQITEQGIKNASKFRLKSPTMKILFENYYRLLSEYQGKLVAECKLCVNAVPMKGHVRSTSSFVQHLQVCSGNVADIQFIFIQYILILLHWTVLSLTHTLRHFTILSEISHRGIQQVQHRCVSSEKAKSKSKKVNAKEVTANRIDYANANANANGRKPWVTIVQKQIFSQILIQNSLCSRSQSQFICSEWCSWVYRFWHRFKLWNRF